MDTHDDRAVNGRMAGASGLVGRRRELAEVRRLLPGTRLLTLTGAGGVGKSRLARRAAWSLRGWLAIELAAVGLRTTPLNDLVRALDKRLDVPARDGRSGTLPRHQTLRATMDWSFELCSPDERRLWTRLAIFPGGVDLETAEEVCSGDGIASKDVFDLLAGLVDKSILYTDRGDHLVRYRMLDTIRAYGRERLAPAGERALHARYRDHYRRMAEGTRISLLVPDQLDRYRAVRAELPNLRAALDLCFRRREDPHTGLRIAVALWVYWIFSGALNEGRHWLERGLGLVPPADGARAAGLWSDALIAIRQEDLPAAAALAEECRALAERTGDKTIRTQAIEIFGMAALAAGEGRRGFALMREARARHRTAGDVHAVAVNLYYSATFGMAESPENTAALGEELLVLSQAHRAVLFMAYAQLKLAFVAWRQGDPGVAEARMREAATVLGAVSDPWGLIQCLEVLAWTAGTGGRNERAARLLGAADKVRQTLDITPVELQCLTHSHRGCAARARRELGGRAFAKAFRAGAKLRLDRALAYALEEREVGPLAE